MTASAPHIVFFEDDDEAELRLEYIRLMAKHQNKFSPYEVAKYVFRDCRDPELRSQQAAQVWSNDLEVKEAIDDIIMGRNKTSDLDDKSQRLRVLKSIYDDPNTPVKERIAAIRVAAELEGEVIKAVDKKVTIRDNVALPQFTIMRYDD